MGQGLVTRIRKYKLMIAITLYFVALAWAYQANTPRFEAPDEASHFLYSYNLRRENALPILEDRATVFASKSVQRHHPPLYYLVGALLLGELPPHAPELAPYLRENPQASVGFDVGTNYHLGLHPHPDDTNAIERYMLDRVQRLRAFSLLLSVVTLWAIYATLARAFGERVALLGALMAASIPTFIHISASVNNDTLNTLFFTLGILGSVTLWQAQRVTLRHSLLMGALLAGVALTKVNGLVLFGVVYGVAGVAVLTRRLTWRAFAVYLLVTGGLVVVLAGWWYARNVMLYGDLMGLRATLLIWQRGDINALAEATSVYESFWFILGHFNIKGSDWAFTLYLPALMGVGVVMAVVASVRHVPYRPYVLFFVGVFGLVVAALIFATRQINVSQGRLLFPAMVAVAGVLALGWSRLPRLAQVLGVAPLLVLAIVPIFVSLPVAYPRGEKLETLPDSVRPVRICIEDRCLVGYEVVSNPFEGGVFVMRAYFTGAHPANPLFFVKALHPYENTVMGGQGIDTHPAMMPSDVASAGIYEATLRFPLLMPKDIANPFLLRLQIGWRDKRTPDDEGVYIDAVDENGNPLKDAILDGASVAVPAVIPATLGAVLPVVQFGDAIEMTHATHTWQGDTLTLGVAWRFLRPLEDAYRVTVGVRDATGAVIAQWDGIPPAYPPSAWIPDSAFLATYAFENVGAGVELFAGWYHSETGERLPIAPASDSTRDHLYTWQALR